MKSHRFRVGQTVSFLRITPASKASPSGSFRVVALLPEYFGNNQYRLESIRDGHQRVVVESEISTNAGSASSA